MKLSTRSRYGLRFLTELASRNTNEPVFLGDIAKKQDISEKYLSKLVIPLRTAGILTSVRGTHGGYMLSKVPSAVTVREIVEALEGGLQVVECSNSKEDCSRLPGCAVSEIWEGLNNVIFDYLEDITLESVVRRYKEKQRETLPFVYEI